MVKKVLIVNDVPRPSVLAAAALATTPHAVEAPESDVMRCVRQLREQLVKTEKGLVICNLMVEQGRGHAAIAEVADELTYEERKRVRFRTNIL